MEELEKKKKKLGGQGADVEWESVAEKCLFVRVNPMPAVNLQSRAIVRDLQRYTQRYATVHKQKRQIHVAPMSSNRKLWREMNEMKIKHETLKKHVEKTMKHKIIKFLKPNKNPFIYISSNFSLVKTQDSVAFSTRDYNIDQY